MIAIDETKLRSLRFQEALLKHGAPNKEKNLNDYKNTVTEIDEKAFDSILEQIKHIEEHNQSLEDELQFLEGIVSEYNELSEWQLKSKHICKIYGNSELALSDLSRLNIEYIENRINAIRGYLTNLKNIEDNKNKLENLNLRLVEEENRKDDLEKRLLELEEILRNNFINAEGRCTIDGISQYTNVISEYTKIGFDFNNLLNDEVNLDSLLSSLKTEKAEVSETLRVAEVCYNKSLSSESKQILNEINNEFLTIKYKLAMLKIVSLLRQNSDSYDAFIKKREELLELIKIRLSCAIQLGIDFVKDPLSNAKVDEQLESVRSMPNNSGVISEIRKDISELNSRTEGMLAQNNEYLITLSDTKYLIVDNIGMNDVDISSVLSLDDFMKKREVADNQVINVKEVCSKVNMTLVEQKTSSVIKRVNQMMNGSEVEDVTQGVEFVPEIVIVPGLVSDENLTHEDVLSEEVATVGVELSLPEKDDDIFSEENEEIFFGESDDEQKKEVSVIFETVTPFEEPELFFDKTEDVILQDKKGESSAFSFDEIKGDEIKVSFELSEKSGLEHTDNDAVYEMPEAFWVTQEEEKADVSVNENVSFDAQIETLLSENKDAGKVKKRAA